ncbi:MAG TPA: hypothetical protein VFB59_05205 [Candidatus Saccharimonadales bacterium]|nr:hypothetical protein [Candidatus Saccharimonadales bacterium]
MKQWRELAFTVGFMVDTRGTPHVWVPIEEQVHYQETDFAHGRSADKYPVFTKEHVSAMQGLAAVIEAVANGELQAYWHGVPLDKK